MNQRLNLSNWITNVSFVKGDVASSLIAAGILTVTWIYNRKNEQGHQYVVHMVPIEAPRNAVIKMPGIYITRELKEVKGIESSTRLLETTETRQSDSDRDGRN